MMEKEYAVGIDIGGTSIKHGIFSNGGKLICWDSVETHAEAPREEILERLSAILLEDLQTARDKKITIFAAGVGTPGSVDIERGFLMGGTPNFVHWRNVSISEFLREKTGLPVYADNDANLMAYGEYVFGAGKGKKDVICITLGTGIGGGIIIDGELYRGSYYAGHELGHMSIDYDGRKCNCGGIGCFEKYASANALIEDYNSLAPSARCKNTKQIFDRYYSGDPLAKQAVDQYISYLGAGLANIINIFNPQIVIIGGGVSEAGEDFIKKVYLSARSRTMPTSFERVEIVRAHLGNRAGMLGAAAFALNLYHKTGK
jgi:glucokinase